MSELLSSDCVIEEGLQMEAREYMFDCEVFFKTVEAIWGEGSVWVDYRGVSDSCMAYS